MKALKKTISYRITVLIGSALLYVGSWFVVGNPAGAVVSGFVLGEVYRSGVYYAHEKAWEEKPKTKVESMPEEYKRHSPDEFLR